MDLVRLSNPWALALLVPAWAILLWAALRGGGTGGGGTVPFFGRRTVPFFGRRKEGTLPLFGRPGAGLRAALACLAAGLLGLALAGPSVRTSEQGRCPVFILDDVSGSMKPPGRFPPGADAPAAYAAALPRGHTGLVRFAAQSAVAVRPFTPQAERLDAAAFLADLPAGDDAETNLEAALAQAAAEMPHGGVLLLYSDALQTLGDAVRAAAAMPARGIRVHALLPALAPRDVRIAAVSAPAHVPVGAAVPIEVRLAATVPVAGTVTVERLSAGEPTRRWERPVAVDPSAGATMRVEDAPAGAGLCEYRVEVRWPDDQWPQNNRAACAVRVGRVNEVVWVHAGEAPGPVLSAFETAAPADVRLKAVRAGEAGQPAAGAAAVVLDNVSAWALGPEAAQALARRVTDGGLGLLVLGGDAAFAAGGYADSPLEGVLPVSSRPAERPPLAIVLVVDSSGSMNEAVGQFRKLTLAKQAVLALRPALEPADRVGIVAFAGEPRVASPLLPLAEWEALRGRLVAIEAGGGTRITPAVLAAIGLFGPWPGGSDKTVRHVLLLSDGRSEDFDLPALVAAARNVRASVSVVATGADADRDRLGRLAHQTSGRLHVTADLPRLAETFLKDLTWVRGEGLRQEARAVRWVQAEPIWRQAGPPLPAVAAFNLTRAKDGADVLWTGETGAAATETSSAGPAPLLAAWRRGLGKAAAMPWPAGEAAGPWTQGNALGRYLADVVAWLCGRPVPLDWSARLERRGEAWWVRIEQRPEAIGRPGAAFTVAVFGRTADAARNIPAEQVAPGIWEARMAAPPEGAPAAVVVRGPDAAATDPLAIPYLPPREFERFGTDRERLEEIVRAGGGAIQTSPESFAETVRRTETRGYMPVGMCLVWAAAACVVAQVVLRLLGRT